MRTFKQGDTAWAIRKGEVVEVQILGTVNKTSYIGSFNDHFMTVENSIYNIPALFDEENLYKTPDEARLLLTLEGI